MTKTNEQREREMYSPLYHATSILDDIRSGKTNAKENISDLINLKEIIECNHYSNHRNKYIHNFMSLEFPTLVRLIEENSGVQL